MEIIDFVVMIVSWHIYLRKPPGGMKNCTKVPHKNCAARMGLIFIHQHLIQDRSQLGVDHVKICDRIHDLIIDLNLTDTL